ncbi:MAG: hypothetical protein O7C75_11060 [Verrucomicrobia bacterium]|nr:hypothetical protein [Verrucomicrobiota bacterium]
MSTERKIEFPAGRIVLFAGPYMTPKMKHNLDTNLRLNVGLLLAAVLLFAGCAHVPVYEQELVSKVGMTRSDSMVEGDRINLLSQIEPGSSVSGGAVAAGCTACR